MKGLLYKRNERVSLLCNPEQICFLNDKFLATLAFARRCILTKLMVNFIIACMASTLYYKKTTFSDWTFGKYIP